MKTYLALILGLLCCVLWGVLRLKKSQPGVARPAGASAASERAAEAKQKLAEHLAEKAEAVREGRVDLDARLAKGAAGETEEVILTMTRAILERSREDRRALLLGWQLSEAEMARIEEIQLEHWRMQYRDTTRDFLDRPSEMGDRSDAKRVADYESKVRRHAGAAKEVFRMDLLAVLANPERVEAYVQHEMRLVEKLVREARRESDAAMGKGSSSDD